jgi:hypothetical protein
MDANLRTNAPSGGAPPSGSAAGRSTDLAAGAALQAPIMRGAAEALGPRTFRKQIGKVGRIEHPDGPIDFTAQDLETYAQNFREQAYDQVPFTLVDDANAHNDDPRRFQGDVIGVETEGEKLYALMNLSEDGAKMVRDNPKLGVSMRIRERPSPGYSTPRKWPAIEHVAATFRPVIDGMDGWESFSDLSTRYGSTVVDLTASTYQESHTDVATETPLTDEEVDQLKALDAAEVRGLLSADEPADDQEPHRPIFPTDDDRRSLIQRLFGRDQPTDAEIDAELQTLVEQDGPEQTEQTPLAANLSASTLTADDRSALDLAQQRVSTMEATLAKERADRDASDYIRSGVPKSLVDLARPALESPEEVKIDLSTGGSKDARSVIRSILDEAKGTIDFSEAGSSEDADNAKATAEQWGKENA